MKIKRTNRIRGRKNTFKTKSREPGDGATKNNEPPLWPLGLKATNPKRSSWASREYLVDFRFLRPHINPHILEGPNLPWLFQGLNFGLDMSSRVFCWSKWLRKEDHNQINSTRNESTWGEVSGNNVFVLVCITNILLIVDPWMRIPWPTVSSEIIPWRELSISKK